MVLFQHRCCASSMRIWLALFSNIYFIITFLFLATHLELYIFTLQHYPWAEARPNTLHIWHRMSGGLSSVAGLVGSPFPLAFPEKKYSQQDNQVLIHLKGFILPTAFIFALIKKNECNICKWGSQTSYSAIDLHMSCTSFKALARCNLRFLAEKGHLHHNVPGP